MSLKESLSTNRVTRNRGILCYSTCKFLKKSSQFTKFTIFTVSQFTSDRRAADRRMCPYNSFPVQTSTCTLTQKTSCQNSQRNRSPSVFITRQPSQRLHNTRKCLCGNRAIPQNFSPPLPPRLSLGLLNCNTVVTRRLRVAW